MDSLAFSFDTRSLQFTDIVANISVRISRKCYSGDDTDTGRHALRHVTSRMFASSPFTTIHTITVDVNACSRIVDDGGC
jgi:hypothetical protein